MNNNSPTEHLLYAAGQELALSNTRRAIKLLRGVADKLGQADIRQTIDRLEARYFYMLRFISSNPLTANAAEIKSLHKSIADIIDNLNRAIESRKDSLYAAQIRFEDMRPEENIQSIISDYLSEAERLRTDVASLTDSKARATLERLATDVFSHIWTIYKTDAETAGLINDIIGDTAINASHRELWVNALGMAATYRHDKEILNALYQAAGNTDSRIRVAAAVWLAIISTCFASMIDEDDARNIWVAVRDRAAIDPLAIFKAMIQNLSDSDDDLFSEIATLSQRLRGIDPRNPEAIKNVDLSSEDYERLKRFNEAQAEGADVFGRSIGRMRQFPFFATLANWFLPFDPQHSALAEITDGEGAEIAETIAKMPNLTDSDKYAMLLSMAQMPAAMRGQTLSSMVDGMRSVSDTPEFRNAMEEIENVSVDALIANQIHALMRFIKSFPKAYEFPLTIKWTAVGMLNPNGVRHALDSRGIMELAEFADCHKYSQDALSLFELVSDEDRLMLGEKENELYADLLGRNIYETDNVDKAVTIYRLILAGDSSRTDIAVKIARLLLATDRAGEAVQQLLDAGADNSADIATLLLLADCYLADGRYYDAIEILHKADYMLPADDGAAKIKLAKAYLLSNQPDEAMTSIEMVPEPLRDSELPFFEAITLWLTGHAGDAIDKVAATLKPDNESENEKTLNTLSQSIDSLASSALGESNTYPSLRTLPDILRYRTEGSQFGNL